MKKYIVISLIALFLIGLFIALSITYSPTAQQPFTILISREPDSLNFLFSKQGVSLYIQKAIFRNLVEVNDKLKPYPELATKIPTIENGLVTINKDNTMKVIWKLRKNLKWADGQKLSTKDILFTYNLLKNQNIISFAREKTDAKYIQSITIKENSNSFVVVWKKPYYNYLYAHPVLPRHALAKYMDKPKNLARINFNKNPVGNGPYKLKLWKAGSYILLEKNPHYHKNVNLDNIAFKIVKDVNSLIINLIAGDGHASTTLSNEQYKFLNKNYPHKIKTWTTQSMTWLHIDLNLENPLLGNKNIRKAILHAINKKQIAMSIYQSKIPTLAKSWLPPKHYAYHEPSINYPYDKEKALGLLGQEGWMLNDKGLLQKNNETLTLSLITDSKDSTRKRIAIFIREYLKEIGIRLKIKSHTTRVIFGKLLPTRQFDMALYAWHMNQLIDGEIYWASYKIPNDKTAGLNFGSFQNKEIDSIQEKLHSSIKVKERIRLLKRHQEIWKEKLPALPIFIPYSMSATTKGLRNWKMTGSSVPITWNCEEWTF